MLTKHRTNYEDNMSERINDIVQNLLEGINGIAKSETIIGKPQQAGEASVVPVHRLKVAFGVGSARAGAQSSRLDGKTGGMGAGGAVQIEPVAAIAVGKDSIPRILTVDGEPETVWSSILADIPDALGKIVTAVSDKARDTVQKKLEGKPAREKLPEISTSDKEAGELFALSSTNERSMCELLGMECNVPTDIVFSFAALTLRGGNKGPHADGWGLALYEGHAARIFLEPTPASNSLLANFVKSYPIKTLLAIAHVRKKTRGQVSLGNTHPFVRELWGRHVVFAHNGKLPKIHQFPLKRFHPIGNTDSEYAFCIVLDYLAEQFPTYPRSRKQLWQAVAHIGAKLGTLGSFNFLLGDGTHLFARCATKLQYIIRRSPFSTATLADDDFSINFAEVTTPNDRVAVIATAPLTRDEVWTPGIPNTLWVFQGGELKSTLES
jgi:predicted glutamine amidotransferase/uncharacterized spore protein YtfJ